MSNFPFYENINLNTVLPVLIQKHYNDSTGAGCEFHWHEEIEIYYVKSGGLKLNSRGSVARLNTGDIGLVGWGHPHRGSNFKDGTVHYILQIDLSKCAYLSRYEVLQIPELLPRVFIFGNEYLANILDGIIYEYETRSVGYDLKIMSGFPGFFHIYHAQLHARKCVRRFASEFKVHKPCARNIKTSQQKLSKHLLFG